MRTDSQLVEGYVRVVALLAERPRGHEIAPMDVGSALASEMEVSKPDALRRHIELCAALVISNTSRGARAKPDTGSAGRDGSSSDRRLWGGRTGPSRRG